jgi:ribonuclease E
MPKQIIIAEEHRVAAVFAEEQIQEIIVAKGSHQVGDIYLGIVENVLPGIDAAFVNLGSTERNGFIHVTDLGPVRLKRRSGSITELLIPQQKVLVQIMKEPTGNKGPRLTGNISLPGRYLVLLPYGRGVNLSRRILQEEERNRLRALGVLIKPAGMGVLVRTEAEGVSEDAIIEDLELLQAQWEDVQQQVTATRAPALLDRDSDFIQKVLRDVYSSDVNRIVVDSTAGLQRVKTHLMNWNGNRLPQGILVDQHRERESILSYFRVNSAIREALKPRVDLPSGGYIIIERTEALTVIDVNSGSFTRSATARETVLWTNCEAAVEIARQLRLRNIAGVIIVDFIDMDARRDQLQVLEHFHKALKADKARPQIAQLTELGLVELTRKRQGQNIYELFGQACPTCGGLGHLAHLPGETPTEEGESLDQVSSRLFAKTSAAPEWGRTKVGISSDLDLNGLEELDLTNHPSYQETGNRNRRQRSRLSSSLSAGLGSSRLVRKELPEEKATRSSGRALSGRGVPERLEPRGRGRRESTKLRSEAPPEIISVRMSEREQQVYAFLGISPLVLHEGDVRHPKSAMVNVLLPDELGAEPVSVTPQPIVLGQNGDSPKLRRRRSLDSRGEASSEETFPIVNKTPILRPQGTGSLPSSPVGNPPMSSPVIPSISSSVTVPPTLEQEPSESLELSPRDVPEPRSGGSRRRGGGSASTSPRRRRRRSSASSQQLSLGTSLD